MTKNSRTFDFIAHLCLSGVLLLFSTTSQADTFKNSSPYLATLCQASIIQICGYPFTTQTGALGTILTFTLPEQYKIRTATVQCVGDNNVRGYYRLMDEATARCELKTCDAGTASVCGADIPVPEKTSFGNVIKTTIPSDLLVAERRTSPVSIPVRCTIEDHVTKYVPENNALLSCNDFLCQPATLDVCGSTVSITEPARLGVVRNMTAKNGQPVTVQCLASNGKAPAFIITDHTCR